MKWTRNWLWGFVVNFTCEKGLVTRIQLAYILIQMLQTDWLSCRPLMCVQFVSWKFRRRLKKILMVNSIKFLTTSKLLNELIKSAPTQLRVSVWFRIWQENIIWRNISYNSTTVTTTRLHLPVSKQLLDEVLWYPEYIMGKVGVISWSKRLITITESLIIQDFTKTESHNRFFRHWTKKIEMFLHLHWRQARQSARAWHDYPKKSCTAAIHDMITRDLECPWHDSIV